MKLFLEVIVLCCSTGLARPNQTFDPNYRRRSGYENPQPLPSTLMPYIAMVRDPFPQLYQGTRRKSLDRRVFKKEFDYAATDTGHRILCESLMECVITYVAIETENGIPIILRGGVGYRHFSIVVRAKPGDPIKGNIRVYCNKDLDKSRAGG